MKKIYHACCLLSLVLLSACASRLAVESPSNVDISGTWLLDPSYSQEVYFAQNNRKQGRGGKGGGGKGGGKGGPPGGSGGQRNSDSASRNNEGQREQKKTPAMTATQMTIIQNIDSMGVAYPDANYRDVDWGKTKYWNSTVDAGWDKKQSLVIETKDKRSDIKETYYLDDSGQILILTIDVNGSEQGGEFIRVFKLNQDQ